MPLKKSYKNNEGIPTLIMVKELNVIDGFQRLAALFEVQFETVQAFIKI